MIPLLDRRDNLVFFFFLAQLDFFPAAVLSADQ